MKEFWENYPEHEMTTDVYFYYAMETGSYLSFLLFPFLEIKRKDFALIYLHHLIAFGLLYAGYMLNLNRFGMSTILLLDSASIWVELCRLAMYLSLERMKNVCFIILAVVWFVTRLVIFPLR